MKKEKLIEIREHLATELSHEHSDDDHDLIQKVISDIDILLNYSHDRFEEEKPTIKGRISEAIDRFEETHPMLASNLGHLMDLLSQWGI